MCARKTLFLPHILLLMLAALSILLSFGCNASSESMRRMDRAGSLMESRPDSALLILDSISARSLFYDKEKARYALLKSMALDKNYVDTITFDVLQPAIDYYLKKGSSDERLRTLYYQGRIFQNRKEDEEAMRCFIKAIELKDNISDSLTLARVYYARSLMYYNTHQYEEYVVNSLSASQLYNTFGDNESKQLCQIYAMEGAITLEDRNTADSIFRILHPFISIFPTNAPHFRHALILYAKEFLSPKEATILLDSLAKQPTNETLKLDLSLAYSNAKNNVKARQYLDSIDQKNIINENKYYSIRAEVMKNAGNYQEAYNSLLNYQQHWELEMNNLLSEDILFVEKKYELEKM